MQQIPSEEAMKNWTLLAVHQLGGSGHNLEIEEQVRQMLHLPDEVADQLYRDSRRPVLEHRVAFARSHLKRDGLLDNPKRSIWVLTEAGAARASEIVSQVKDFDLSQLPAEDAAEADTQGEVRIIEDEWREDLLSRILRLSPNAFERLCQRLLRENGFVQVQVTGRSGDSGIDGHGVLQMGRLISFPVLFQCKRWQNPVGASVVRDFLGAMLGRADRGLIITTSTFTTAAREEVSRNGVPPVDLVDGHALAENLRELKLGVKEVVAVDQEWFDQLESWASDATAGDAVFGISG